MEKWSIAVPKHQAVHWIDALIIQLFVQRPRIDDPGLWEHWSTPLRWLRTRCFSAMVAKSIGFLGKIDTGNHGFYHQIGWGTWLGVLENCPIIQFYWALLWFPCGVIKRGWPDNSFTQWRFLAGKIIELFSVDFTGRHVFMTKGYQYHCYFIAIISLNMANNISDHGYKYDCYSSHSHYIY